MPTDHQSRGGASTAPDEGGYVEMAEPPVPEVAYSVINPLLSLLLRSPLHGLVSDALTLITFSGRKSGDEYSTPVGYWVRDGTVVVTTQSPWWRNCRDGATVWLHLKGERREGRAHAHPEPEVVAEYVETYIERYGIDAASRLGIRVRGDRPPTREELEAAVEGTVVIDIDLVDGEPPGDE